MADSEHKEPRLKEASETQTADQEPRLDDSSLIADCLAGDSKAWEALIARYQRLIYSVPIKIGFSPMDAADIFQAVCVKLFERLGSLRDHDRLSSWLMTTTTRECWRVASLRRRETQSQAYDDDYGKDLLERLEAEEPLADERRIAYETQQIVREAIAKLSEKCRNLITMLFYQKDDLSYSEIAKRAKIPLNSLGPTRARCLKKLKTFLAGKL
jgi:RNA polymerase sigma factor (sigma-70 family)